MPSFQVLVRLAAVPGGAGRQAAALARAVVERQARVALGWNVADLGEGGQSVGLTWKRTEDRKPYLAECPEFSFSVSYTRRHVGVAFAGPAGGPERAGGPDWARDLGAVTCGLDLELVGRTVNLALADRFAADERDYILSGPSDLTGQRLLDVWTKKEAYLKWLGVGMRAGLGSFTVLDPVALGVGFLGLAPGLADGLIGHVCVERPVAAACAGGVREEWLDRLDGASSL
ncbi:MAG: 4'-phosphopantetheinyl transferase superfamily protein [Bifidobacteriaceae bacterium]|jgi:hypothetical protein|nr:4'-phosphopantetheinyl transferase superfamily protein [Bifidobacteriaceae bacterium]